MNYVQIEICIEFIILTALKNYTYITFLNALKFVCTCGANK